MLYVLRRLTTAFITIFLVALLGSLAILAVPGDPAEVILGTNAELETLVTLRKQLRLDVPPIELFFGWFLAALQGDFGQSTHYKKPVTQLIMQRLSVSISLAIGGILVACLIAVPLGILSALKQGSYVDTLIISSSQVGAAVPSFWLGLLLILLFSVELDWLPATEFVPWNEFKPLQTLKSLLLPILALGLGQAAIIMRMTRASILDILKQNYMLVARAKGLNKRRLIKHALRGALATIITVVSLGFAELLIGTIIIEEVFSLSGMGRLLLTAVDARDFPLLQGQIFIYASFIVLLNTLADLSYLLLDPRISYR